MLLISLPKFLQQGSLSTLEQVMMCSVHWITAVEKLTFRDCRTRSGLPCGEFAGIGMALKCTFAYS